MTEKHIPLQLTAGIALPQNVILPMSLARRYGVDRRLTITKRTQVVPAGIASWLRGDPRYAGWFEAEPIPPQPEEPQAARAGQPEPVGEQEHTDVPAEPASTPVVEPWSLTMTVPVLREYARAHGVALTSEDSRKDDVIAKLRAAGLPEKPEAS